MDRQYNGQKKKDKRRNNRIMRSHKGINNNLQSTMLGFSSLLSLLASLTFNQINVHSYYWKTGSVWQIRRPFLEPHVVCSNFLYIRSL
jgi:hypothetical protein